MHAVDFLAKESAKFDLKLDDTALNRFSQYYDLLIEWNQKINLTAITAFNEVMEKHFLDCLMIFKYCLIPKNAKLIDVGSGAGFPGIVLKIARPDIELTLLDSLNKRVLFLNALSEALALPVSTIHMRAETGGNTPFLRESFDFAVSRAVARLPVLGEYCLPFVKPNGALICLKGPQPQDEILDAHHALSLLGGTAPDVIEFNLPNGDGRSLVYIKKISQTPPKYPRQGTKISKKPLS